MKQIKPQYNCSLELAMELVGGKWKLVLLWHLLSGTKRVSEIKRKLGDITQKMLTLQLWVKVLIASVPAAIIGLLFDDFIDAHFRSSRPMWNIR